MQAKLLIAEPLDFSAEALDILRQVATVDVKATSRVEFKQAWAEYDVIWFRLAHRIDRALLQGDVRTQILATPVTGLDHIDLDACRDRGIRVVSLKGETEFLREIRATAELTLALALALLRQIPQAAQHVLDAGWDRDRFRGRELFGKTVGLVGAGRLGQIVSEYFRALGCRVLAFDPRQDFPPSIERAPDLRRLLAQADIVSLHVSYDRSTHHLIGPDELAAIKPGAVLINTARGGVLDEGALLTALESGRVAGAALDVVEGEPDVSAEHPLVAYAQSHANLLIVPHIGGNTAESFAKTEVFLAQRVVEALGQCAALSNR